MLTTSFKFNRIISLSCHMISLGFWAHNPFGTKSLEAGSKGLLPFHINISNLLEPVAFPVRLKWCLGLKKIELTYDPITPLLCI